MAQRVRIDCINKNPRNDPHHRITHVGSPNDDGTRWKLSEGDAIAGIRAGKWEFYVHAGDRVVNVVIARAQSGRDYLKTVDDNYAPDNLLNLDECP